MQCELTIDPDADRESNRYGGRTERLPGDAPDRVVAARAELAQLIERQ
jgi:hypothetical protein